MSNPYEVVGSPSYAGPMVNWFGGQQGQGNRQQPQQQQAQPGQPQPGQPGMSPGGQQPTQAQQQMQGLGGYLQKLFGGGAPGAAGAGAAAMNGPGQTLYPQGAMGPNQPSNPYQNNGY